MATLILVSRADSASVNIRDALLDAGGWEDAGSFHGLPVRKRGGATMAEVEPLLTWAQGRGRALTWERLPHGAEHFFMNLALSFLAMSSSLISVGLKFFSI